MPQRKTVKKGPVKPPLKKPAKTVAFLPQPAAAEIVVSTSPPVEDWLAGRTFDNLEEAALFIKQVESNTKLLNYKRQMGDLIEWRMVIEMAHENSVQQADKLNALIDRMSPELAAITDPKLVRTYLQEKFHGFFIDLKTAWLYPKRTA